MACYADHLAPGQRISCGAAPHQPHAMPPGAQHGAHMYSHSSIGCECFIATLLCMLCAVIRRIHKVCMPPVSPLQLSGGYRWSPGYQAVQRRLMARSNARLELSIHAGAASLDNGAQMQQAHRMCAGHVAARKLHLQCAADDCGLQQLLKPPAPAAPQPPDAGSASAFAAGVMTEHAGDASISLHVCLLFTAAFQTILERPYRGYEAVQSACCARHWRPAPTWKL